MRFLIRYVIKSYTNRHCYQVSICNRGDRKIFNDIKQVFILKESVIKGRLYSKRPKILY